MLDKKLLVLWPDPSFLKKRVILRIPYLHILRRQFSPFHFFMHDLKEQTEVAVFLSLGREFHNVLPRKDKLSLP